MASWIPFALERPKVASVPVMLPTSPMTMGPVALGLIIPLPWSCFLQAASAAMARRLENILRMAILWRRLGKAALLNTPRGCDQPSLRSRSCMVQWLTVPSPRILVVDDNPELLTLLSSSFEEAG